MGSGLVVGAVFIVFVAIVALASAVYLGLEAATWAGLYLSLGASAT